MKIMKRLFCLSIAILLLCTSLTACTPQQEEISELDLIKAEWQRYVIDRTEKVNNAVVIAPWHSSYASLAIYEQSVINEILDICQTLIIEDLTLLEDHSTSMSQYYLVASLHMKELPDTSGITIYMLKSGEAYLRFVTDDTERWAYVSGWPVYEQLEEYRYYVPTQEDK